MADWRAGLSPEQRRAVPELERCEWPEETLADCARCPMTHAPGELSTHERPFPPDVRCCVREPDLSAPGIERIMARGGRGAEVLRTRLEEEERDASGGLPGRARHGCGFWVEGLLGCSIHPDRPPVCRTWFCKNVDGSLGHAQWQAARAALEHAEASGEGPGLDALRRRIAEAEAARRAPLPDVVGVTAPASRRVGDEVEFQIASRRDRARYPADIFETLARLDGVAPWRGRVEPELLRDLVRAGIVGEPVEVVLDSSESPAPPRTTRTEFEDRMADRPVERVASPVLGGRGRVVVRRCFETHCAATVRTDLAAPIRAVVSRHEDAFRRTDDYLARALAPGSALEDRPLWPVDADGIRARLLDSGHVVQGWPDAELRDLFAAMGEVVTVLAASLGIRDAFRLGTGWCHRTPRGGEMDYHAHGGRPGEPIRGFACVFYVDAGTPVPGRPESGSVSYVDAAFRREILVRPKTGLITAFPSHVRHGVLPYYGRGERIVIGCNFTRLELTAPS